MVADTRLNMTQPLRAVVATVLYPVQWLALRPVLWTQASSAYFTSLTTAKANEAAARAALGLQAQRANQVEQLALENVRLRHLLALRERLGTSAQAAQVLYDAADPYAKKVIIDQGANRHIEAGSPVLDENGVLGQVTRVYPLMSEVTLVTDRDHAIPVLNTRSGVRGLAFGDSASRTGALELRFMDTNADIQAGDLLTTSGVDGVYPPGLPVARVQKVERRVDSAFARILCTPLALVSGVSHVMVLKAVEMPTGPRPEPPAAATPVRKGGRR